MNPEIKGDIETNVSLQPNMTNEKIVEQSKGFIQNLIKKISENKIYQYIAICILILVVVAFFYFKKSKKEIKPINKNQPALPKQNNEPSLSGLNNEDHFILDANGNPMKVSGSFSNQLLPLPIPKQQPSQQDIQMLQKQMQEKQMQEYMQQQMMQQQMMQQQMMQQQMMQQNNSRPKLQHPESDMSDNIDVDLAKIQDNEDENVAQHNLTNSELAEINNKIEMMSSQK